MKSSVANQPASDSSEPLPERNAGVPSTDVQQPLSGIRQAACILLAGLFFCLGALGAVMPLLPTTPFLLLTSFFLVKSSPRLNRALLQSRFFGPILNDWQQHHWVRRQIKVKAVVVVVFMVAASIYITAASRGLTLTIVALATAGIVVVLRLPEPP